MIQELKESGGIRTIDFNELTSLLTTINSITETESAYKRAQQFLLSGVSTYNVHQLKEFVEQYLRNR